MNEKDRINEGIIQSVFYSDGLLKNNETNWPKQHNIYPDFDIFRFVGTNEQTKFNFKD